MSANLPNAAAHTAFACPALFISAVASGQGKTSVTAALARLHSRKGRGVRVFKTGPDFLDPKILEMASAASVFNIDTWMVGIEESRALLAEAAQASDLILIEGAMGLFDGEPSAADLARELGVPIAALIDASAMAQTFGAVAHGLRSYRPTPFAGVIANRVAGPTHARMLADSLQLGTRLLAALPQLEVTLAERHLGLVADAQGNDIMHAIDLMADALQASGFTDLPAAVTFPARRMPPVEPLLARRTVAVARDAAFSFIYPANLRCLTDMGARLRFFSPVADEPVPDSDALYLPGGYPELHAETLARNHRWNASVRAYTDSARPVLAECGGMMAIVDTLVTADGRRHAMAGLLPGTVFMTDRVTAIGLQALPLPEGELRAHTFHHSRMESPAEPSLRSIPHRYVTGEAVYRQGSITATYVHAYFRSNARASAGLLLPRHP
ncbi:MAG: cobyrinate a,c-diamide synthase [Pseudomonadota bacterium]|nr:cobyrinate a,c-diamide synthase [Pseudomonadota bacterium]